MDGRKDKWMERRMEGREGRRTGRQMDTSSTIPCKYEARWTMCGQSPPGRAASTEGLISITSQVLASQPGLPSVPVHQAPPAAVLEDWPVGQPAQDQKPMTYTSSV